MRPPGAPPEPIQLGKIDPAFRAQPGEGIFIEREAGRLALDADIGTVLPDLAAGNRTYGLNAGLAREGLDDSPVETNT